MLRRAFDCWAAESYEWAARSSSSWVVSQEEEEEEKSLTRNKRGYNTKPTPSDSTHTHNSNLLQFNLLRTECSLLEKCWEKEEEEELELFKRR